MESPPSTSLWSEAFILSDDSGLLLNSSSISSGESHLGFAQLPYEYQSDKSLSQVDSLDGMSDIIAGENFNTLKKGPHWSDAKTIEPPLEFQDHPVIYHTFAEDLSNTIMEETFCAIEHQQKLKERKAASLKVFRPIHQVISRTYWTQEFLPYSPCLSGRPSSRSSLGSSRLSSSHNSLSVPTAHRVDDSSFITQAVSHDTLSSDRISDLYNVPFDSDVYAVPVDTLKPPLRPRNKHKRRRRNTAGGFKELERPPSKGCASGGSRRILKCDQVGSINGKRHSVAGTSAANTDNEPVHMTLQEVRQYLQNLHSSSSDSSEMPKDWSTVKSNNNNNNYNINRYADPSILKSGNVFGAQQPRKKPTFLINIKNKKVKDSSCDTTIDKQIGAKVLQEKQQQQQQHKKTPAPIFWLKQTLCNMFRFRKMISPELLDRVKKNETGVDYGMSVDSSETRNILKRALPPLPPKGSKKESPTLDFTTSIRKVKDYGWYWGPLSSEAAEKVLSNEPTGSFIVRDSSDDHYIFSLTFKLNNTVRHVRIENDQGNFSFGSCTKFKSQTIVDFIENAVEHSRSGRYLFFLHRRPTIGPVRVQLLHPVSRFKQIQSLQHMCRFAILKKVRKDLIPTLPLPRRIIDYLSTPHYYSENMVDMDETAEENDFRNCRNQDSSEEYGSEMILPNEVEHL